MVSTALIAIDATILATAVHPLVQDLGGFAAFPWLFSIYLLAQAVSVPIYSKLADTIGRKPIILIGIGLFLLGSVLSGFAWSMPVLIAFRALQGIGAGAVQPMSITIIGDIYTVAERARVQGYVASMWAISSVVGPTLGGLFSQFASWRWIFFVNVPLCVLAFVLLLRGFHEKVEKTQRRIDVPGAALLAASTALIILGILEGGVAWPWDSPISIAVFVVGAALLVAFLLVERRAREPVLPLWVFRRRLLLTTSLSAFAVGAALVGLTSYIPTYLQVSLGVTPLVAGLALAALTIGWPISATFAGRIYLRIGFRLTAILGAAIVVVGAVLLAAVGLTPSIVLVAVFCFVIGAGFGWANVSTLIAAQASVEWNERGVVTGANMFARSIGSAVGAAVLGAIANGVIAANGGNESDPASVTLASTAVFVGVVAVGIMLLVSVVAMPRTPVSRAPLVAPGAVEEQPTTTGPIGTAGH
ncbi:MFS transporter [Lysinimonas soli]|uniref:MFS transporter n=1 Tax=Lysinimonas soli TaxID=1074233 RepID=A0ABW0NJZ7_9MICO